MSATTRNSAEQNDYSGNMMEMVERVIAVALCK